jgi:hypothetical protein
MASIRLQTYSLSHQNNNEQSETLIVDFESDYSDVFPSPIHLQRFLQNFFDVMWKSFLTESSSSVSKMHKFSLLGGDDESIDVQFTLVVYSSSSNEKQEEIEQIKTAQAFFPDDEEIMAMHKEFLQSLEGGGRRMNDGGEYVDDDEEDEDYY